MRELGAGLKACTCREAEFEMLLLRSEAYCGISKQLREIPAAQVGSGRVWAGSCGCSGGCSGRMYCVAAHVVPAQRASQHASGTLQRHPTGPTTQADDT